MKERHMVIEHEEKVGDVRVRVHQFPPSLNIFQWCDGCNELKNAPLYQREDDSNKYCEYCFDAVRDEYWDHF